MGAEGSFAWIHKRAFKFKPLYLLCYDSINKIDRDGCEPEEGDLWGFLGRVKSYYDKLKDFLSDVAVSWYVLLKDLETSMALRRQLREWRPRRDDIDWSKFSPLLKSHIMDSMKHAAEAAANTGKFIYSNVP